MHKFSLFILITTLFTACSSKNAFDQFHYNQERQKSEDTILSQKILKEKRVEGVANVIYLNKVLPKRYKEEEYFYIYLYTKEKKISFLLNEKKPLHIEKLPSQNRFTHLSSFDAKWNSYYLVTFEKDPSNRLVLTLKTQNGAHATFLFIKDK